MPIGSGLLSTFAVGILLCIDRYWTSHKLARFTFLAHKFATPHPVDSSRLASKYPFFNPDILTSTRGRTATRLSAVAEPHLSMAWNKLSEEPSLPFVETAYINPRRPAEVHSFAHMCEHLLR
ncbi:hypothetical protein FA13DRAFT_1731917 [Coprinellus micaceus]|uniref:Uncharacterized protein n=1 Tax=Coprinellus micaceus TaxID=71717 RepID=A0A4Y7TDZ0_COPMI|nr:hypothetical protein FA13DRAFT_1731917 [Coprinellus micaceus]